MPIRDAQWSTELMQATAAAIEHWAVPTGGDLLCFKHISSGFGIIYSADLMCGNLRMIPGGRVRR
jgi:hypothetical protein